MAEWTKRSMDNRVDGRQITWQWGQAAVCLPESVDKYRQRETETETDRDRQTESLKTERDRQTERPRQTHREADRQRLRQTDRQTASMTEGGCGWGRAVRLSSADDQHLGPCSGLIN